MMAVDRLPTRRLLVGLTLFCCSTWKGVSSQDTKLNEEHGLNQHEELVLFSCLGAVMIMSVTIVLFLWYVVDRTRDRLRHFERHLPVVVRKFRHDIAEFEENENGRVVLMTTTMADAAASRESLRPLAAPPAPPVRPGEVSPDVRPLEVHAGRISLTSYKRKQDVGISTDFAENAGEARTDDVQDEEEKDEPGRGTPSAEEPARKISKAQNGEESKDFLYINGEYIPRDYPGSDGEQPPPGSPPLYAYDNPAYDNTYAKECDDVGDMPPTENNNRRGKKKKKAPKGEGKDGKFTTYESHV